MAWNQKKLSKWREKYKILCDYVPAVQSWGSHSQRQEEGGRGRKRRQTGSSEAGSGIWTIIKTSWVDHNKTTFKQLVNAIINICIPPFPPKKRLHFRSKCREEIVEVHHLEKTKVPCKNSLSYSPCAPLHWRKQQSLRALLQRTWRSQEGTQGQCHWCQPRPPPGLEGHDAVVEDVEEGEVGELLLQHEEDGVGKVDELGEVEEPGKVESTKSLRFVWVVDWLTSQAEKKKLELDKNRTILCTYSSRWHRTAILG